MKEKQNILITPLNWGLGHATRCMPIINTLLKNYSDTINIFIGGDGNSLQLLAEEYPSLDFFTLPAYDITYQDNNKSLVASIGAQVPHIIKQIYAENKLINKLVNTYKIKGIISDNRFGCWSKQTYNVFLTHQVFIKVPRQMAWSAGFINAINHYFINKYQQCWIPDYEEVQYSLSGTLSHKKGKKLKEKFKYIGPLSRFKSMLVNQSYPDLKVDILVVLSGPEPQRTFLEQNIFSEAPKIDRHITLVRGLTIAENLQTIPSNVTIINYLTAHRLFAYLQAANLVICRAGYSSIMDLVTLSKRAILIPTPQQTEQEYLAMHLKNREQFKGIVQSNFNLSELIDWSCKSNELIEVEKKTDEDLMSKYLNVFVSNCLR